MFLADTNVLSELARRVPNAGVVAWAGEVTEVAISAVTIEEIFFGLTWKPSPRISDWFEELLRTFCQVLPVTGEIAKRAGELRGELQARGEQRTQADMLIAATAQVHQLTLVTRNERHFVGCGISLLNPFG